MQMFIFQSAKDPEAYAFSDEQTGITLPQTLAPWLLRGRRDDLPQGTQTGICSIDDALRALDPRAGDIVRVEVRRKASNVVRVAVRRKAT